jgi:hypothetical protein
MTSTEQLLACCMQKILDGCSNKLMCRYRACSCTLGTGDYEVAALSATMVTCSTINLCRWCLIIVLLRGLLRQVPGLIFNWLRTSGRDALCSLGHATAHVSSMISYCIAESLHACTKVGTSKAQARGADRSIEGSRLAMNSCMAPR